MARKKIIAGNWKMNMTPSEAVELVNTLKPLVATEDADVVFCVPAIDIIPILLFIYLLGPSWEYFVSQCSQKAATIPIHMGYVAIVVPTSFVLCLIQIALDIVKQVKGEK